ncbi:MAG: hypothetical protein AB8B63_19445, partial [Granulosicoccus sp.]
GAVDAATDTASDAAGAVADAAGGAVDAATDTASDAAGAVADAAGGAVDAATDTASDAAGAVADAAGGAVDAATDTASDAAGAVTDAAGGAVDSGTETVASAAGQITDATAETASGETQASTSFTTVSGGSMGLADISRKLGSVFGTTSAALTDVTDEASAQAALPQLESASNSLTDVAASYSELPDSAKGLLSRVIDGGINRIKPLAEKALTQEGVGDVLSPVVEPMLETLGTLDN